MRSYWTAVKATSCINLLVTVSCKEALVWSAGVLMKRQFQDHFWSKACVGDRVEARSNRITCRFQPMIMPDLGRGQLRLSGFRQTSTLARAYG
jgi:hypothetical protein